ncbi:MAG: flagellar filament capping protein FliD [Dehalococcoidia bacterium]|uniref:flagellar filament capping protein FliD n=1 Tax=Candidatus Amarobacter glycogenicus TaxID=3140699 RepID=UPI002A0C7AD2|nr:flagellar filament capping protein FliD [Dehalococcoidia bacterium]MBK6561659.1 flagellar filament capping protein FliD [Dehalococcoidia bacterium]MBK9612069.1 flagellar filament capping protein FliD [Dehalococcoidia bacterium]
MSDPVRISGFFSTFDTESVISQLTQVRMNAVTLLEIKNAKAAAKQSAIATVQTSVGALLAKLNALSAANSVSGKVANSSGAAVSVSSTPSSLIGSFTVDVTKLATVSKVQGGVVSAAIDATKPMNESNFGTVPTTGSYTIATATGGAQTFGIGGGDVQSAALLSAANTQMAVTSGTFTIATATGGSSTLTIDAATQSLADVVAAINGSGIGVTATVTDDQYGHANQISVVSTQGAITFGNGADTSNFLSATNLLASTGTTTRTSSAAFTKMMTLNEVIADLNGSAIGVTASITNDANGRANILTVTSTQGNISFGNGADTSNFLSATALITSATGATRSSASPLSRASQSAKLEDVGFNAGPVAAGPHNLVINGVDIAYDASTDSMTDVVNRINASSAGVTARYDSITDTFRLQNAKTGTLSLTVADDGSGGDLAAKLGLIGATFTEGENAAYSIDGGPAQSSASNTITHNGVGVTLNALTGGTPNTVTVTQDTTSALAAVKAFVTDFNGVMTAISAATKADGSKENNTSGPLSGDASLRQLKSDLRSIVTSMAVNVDGNFKTLNEVGISFGPVGSALGATSTLQLDEAKFKTALADDPAGAQALLSALTLSASLQPGGTGSVTGLTGTYSGAQSGKYVIDDDGLGNLTSVFTPANGGPASTTTATVGLNGSTSLLVPGMLVNVGGVFQAGTHTVTVTASSQSVIQRLKQFSEVQSGAGGVLQKRQDAFKNIQTDIAKRIEDVQDRIEKEMEVLRKKFAAMERAQAAAQSAISQLQALTTKITSSDES